MEVNQELKLAVLIDADNIPYSNIKGMLEEIAKYGIPTFKRIYGDWTRPSLSGWKGVLLENAITPIQQYSYTKGKNSTDSALIIDAMDILYTAQVDGFCIISSDSDFTRLATRLREAGKKVFGMGEKKTPISFIASCNKFIYIEILKIESKFESRIEAKSSPAPVPATPVASGRAVRSRNNRTKAAPEKILIERPPEQFANGQKLSLDSAISKPVPIEIIQPEKLVEDRQTVSRPSSVSTVSTLNDAVIRLISASINDLAEEDGWVGLAVLGALIMKKQPDFDPRNYGFKKLVELVKSIPQIEIDKRETTKSNVSHFYVRLKENVD